MPFYLNPPPRNPLARVFTAIVAVLVMAGAFMLGLVALAVVAGLALVIGLAAWLRLWWLRRKLGGQPAIRPDQATGTGARAQVIETEYTVISRKQDS